MDAIGEALNRGPPEPHGFELLYESERTRVTRMFLPGGSVVRKEAFGAGSGEAAAA